MGRYITTTGTASPVTRTISTTYTAEASDRLLCVTTSGAFTVTLPASPIEGDQIQFIDVVSNFEAANLTIARNSKLINGAADNLVADVNGALITLLYTGETYGWVITST
jgi:hypothetical protein